MKLPTDNATENYFDSVFFNSGLYLVTLQLLQLVGGFPLSGILANQ